MKNTSSNFFEDVKLDFPKVASVLASSLAGDPELKLTAVVRYHCHELYFHETWLI